MYPETTKCVCGRDAKLEYDFVIEKYMGKTITIQNVPSYACESFHTKYARKTRLRIKELSREAFDCGLREIEYKD
ncbi:hypothetical protein [Priestia megaterium]|uniref:hypothetical protein n=1 Tax=Priestia megaterium TaxID=1404 RepID=UPI003CC63E18